MILSFKSIFPWDEETRFEPKISGMWGIGGIKPHTIRKGERWTPGDKIHFWLNSPRNPKLFPRPFNLADPRSAELWFDANDDQIKHHQQLPRWRNKWPAAHTEYLPIVYATEEFRMEINTLPNTRFEYLIKIGDKVLLNMIVDPARSYGPADISDFPLSFRWLAYRDGFDAPYDFLRWFSLYREPGKDLLFVGQVVHWTANCLYDSRRARIFMQ